MQPCRKDMIKIRYRPIHPGESDNFYGHKLVKHLGHNADTDIETIQSYKDIVFAEQKGNQENNHVPANSA